MDVEQAPETPTVGDAEIPAVGFGTWRLTGEECREAVRTALRVGYRHIDTAQEYGNERQVGAALRDADVDREDVFLTTKLGRGNRGFDDVIRSTEESLAKLGTDHLDLLLIHWPNMRTPLRETISTMDRLIEEGKVRHIGVSNFDVDRLHRAREYSEHGIVTDQVQYNPFWSQTRLLDYCRIHGVTLTAYSPLSHGGAIDDPVLESIGDRYGKTAAQVAIRWLLQQPDVVTIPKAASEEHIRENLDVFDFELSDEEMDRIKRPSKPNALAGFVRGRLCDVAGSLN